MTHTLDIELIQNVSLSNTLKIVNIEDQRKAKRSFQGLYYLCDV